MLSTSRFLSLKQDKDNLKVFVVIAAAGNGYRFLNNLPKQFSSIDGDIVIRRVVRLFLSVPDISGVVCVIPDGYIDVYNKIFEGVDEERLLEPVFGEDTRQGSVLKGLEAISEFDPTCVLIHDAARHNVSRLTISNVVESLKNNNQAVIPTVKPIDSVRYLNKAINRNDIDLAQTPQGFDFNLIYNLHKKYKGRNASDDASLCDLDRINVNFVEGDIGNKKLTFKEDANSSMIRTGFGFDTHAFSKDSNRPLYLMGVLITGHIGLEGVSDADVGLHSLVDAIIGALALGSIGEHFPSNDPRWKNCDSKIFLKYCADLLKQNRCSIVNIDTTIVCEEPNISAYSDKMKVVVAECLNISSAFVNIKGKTTEGLGFTGRREGISAYSSVLIRYL